MADNSLITKKQLQQSMEKVVDNLGNVSVSEHTHAISDVTDLETELAARSTATNLANGTANGSVMNVNAADASGSYSYAEGYGTTATGNYSHAEGRVTTAEGAAQHVQGKYNVSDTTSAHIVGNGTSSTASNAHTLDWDGNAWFAGDVYVGSTSGVNMDDGSAKLATETVVDEKIGALNYAASSSAGGAATSADMLNTDAGSATQPVYFSNGVPVSTDYSLGASVPSDAVFTDTTYEAATTSEAGLMSAEDKAKLDGIEEGATSGGGVSIISAASEDGVTYTSTVDGIDSLYAGMMIVFIPTMTSTSTAPTLNINGLGAATIKRRMSGLSSTTASGLNANWLYTGKPQIMMYDGTYWIVVNQDKPMLSDLYGSSNLVTFSDGALSTIGGTSVYTYGTDDLEAGVSELATGQLHFVYE